MPMPREFEALHHYTTERVANQIRILSRRGFGSERIGSGLECDGASHTDPAQHQQMAIRELEIDFCGLDDQRPRAASVDYSVRNREESMSRLTGGSRGKALHLANRPGIREGAIHHESLALVNDEMPFRL